MQNIDAPTWKALVVDDDDSNRSVIAYILRYFDAEVIEANSGLAAIAVLDKTFDFSFALFDIQMPGMSGWQLLKELRSRTQSGLSQIPVIAVTALAMQGDKERILAGGFDGYIMKPVDAATFYQQVTEILAACRETRNA